MGGKFFLKELVGKEVITVNDNRVGILVDIVVDTSDGRIAYLIIKTDGSIITDAHKVDAQGRLVVETSRIRIEDNRIVIN